MIYHIYTDEKYFNGREFIKVNDIYFAFNTLNDPITRADLEIIKRVDSADVFKNYEIETPFGRGTIYDLSTGCKTLLNIVHSPQKIVSIFRRVTYYNF